MNQRVDPAIRRLTNLAFALLGADQRGRRYLTADWIRSHVPGYDNRSDLAFTRQLGRDITTLRRAGVPVETQSSGDGNLYRLQIEDYELPAVTFTPEEAAVLGLAGEMGQSGELGVFARSGWTKLAASGADRDLSRPPVLTTVSDLGRLPSALLTDVMTATRHRLRISFDYRPTPTATPQRRIMDPWGLVTLHDRIYLVGWDVQRKAPRSFRVLRISALRQGRQRVDATLRVQPGQGGELPEAGTPDPDDPTTVRLVDVDRDWLVRTAAGAAPGVVVREPADVRQEIIALLRKVT